MTKTPAHDILYVDEHDREVGTGEKLLTHQKGILHRAISVFVFNPRGELMLQKRSKTKYHSAGLWSNTCCSHPRPGEDTAAAARRRLNEEMGLDLPVREVHQLRYYTQFSNGLIENEYDHMFVTESDDAPTLNPDEAENWKWMSPAALKADMAKRPGAYTHWLTLSFNDILAKHCRLAEQELRHLGEQRCVFAVPML